MIRPHGEITPGNAPNEPADSEWPYVDPHVVSALMELARQLFSGKASIEKDRDPEYPADKYYVLRIETDLSPEQAVQAEHQWIDGLLDLAPDCQSIGLLIVSTK